jgi:hypothetical protein
VFHSSSFSPPNYVKQSTNSTTVYCHVFEVWICCASAAQSKPYFCMVTTSWIHVVVSWFMMSCSVVGVNHYFGRVYCLRTQSRSGRGVDHIGSEKDGQELTCLLEGGWELQGRGPYEWAAALTTSGAYDRWKSIKPYPSNEPSIISSYCEWEAVMTWLAICVSNYFRIMWELSWCVWLVIWNI